MPGKLYVVATPLGNLEDISPRAIQILRDVDLIACEDTRHTGKLLNHFSIFTKTSCYHDHNEEQKTRELIWLLTEGKQVALVSDAGTPLVSDPGFLLVRACRERDIPVYPIPGASAAVGALSVSGLPTDCFFFQGFLPRQKAAQSTRLRQLGSWGVTLIIYLSPHGILDTLRNTLNVLGNRRAFLIREMTKIHETHYAGWLGEILEILEREKIRGEFTVVIEGKAPQVKPKNSVKSFDVVAYVTGLKELHDLSEVDAIKRVSKELDLSRREVYRIVQESKN